MGTIQHGHAVKSGWSPEYKAWVAMHNRCNNPATSFYHRYGGRGITVCEAWKDFKQFLSDMGPKPFPKAQLERKDNDGPYSPDNCVWAGQKQQARNKANTVWVEHEGQKVPLVALAESLGIPRARLYQRVVVRGMPVSAAIKEGLNYPSQEVEFNGVRKTLKEWAKESGLKPHTLYYRVNKLGWSVERALSEPVNRLPR